jgi:hypothetical protein
MRDSPLIGMKWVRGSYNTTHDMQTGKWGVTFMARARFQLKGRPHPESLTIHGLKACQKEETHAVYFSTPCRYTFEEAEHLLSELEAGRREGKSLSRGKRRK